MNRYNQIDEMANDIAQICPDLIENSCCEDDSCVSCLTYSLLNKGYRKASEVAREIFDMLRQDLIGSADLEYLERLIKIYEKKYTENV